MQGLSSAAAAPLELSLGRRVMTVWPWTLVSLGRLEHVLGEPLHRDAALPLLERRGAWQWLAMASVRGDDQTSLRRRWQHDTFVERFTRAMRRVNGLDGAAAGPVSDAVASAGLSRLVRQCERWSEWTLAQARLALGDTAGVVVCASMGEARALLASGRCGDTLGAQVQAAWRRVLIVAAAPQGEPLPGVSLDPIVAAVQSVEQAVLRLSQRTLPALK